MNVCLRFGLIDGKISEVAVFFMKVFGNIALQ